MNYSHYDINKLKFEIFNTVWSKVDEIYPLFNERKVIWNKVKDKFIMKINDVNSFENLYDILNEMLLTLKDPHTKIFNYHGGKPQNISPLLVTYKNAKVYVQHVLNSDLNIKPFSEICAINDTSIEQFRDSVYNKYNFNSENVKQMYLIKEITRCFSNKVAKINVKYLDEKCTYELKPLNIANTIKDNCNYHINYCEAKIIDSDILYIKLLTFFDAKIISEFKEIIFRHTNLKRLIIDVRGNNGGLIDVARDITSLLNNAERTVFYKVNKTKSENCEIFSEPIPVLIKNNKIIDFHKLAILCDENTSSSAECIFIKSLINTDDKIKVFGCKTAGLVHESTIYTLFDNTNLQITSYKYLDLDKTLLIEDGIEPNIIINNNINSILNKDDLVLNAAIKFCNL